MASVLRPAQLILVCLFQLVDSICWLGCDHGAWTGGLGGHCVCDDFWDGECCDQALCDKVDDKLEQNVSLSEWVRATWYIQEQQLTGYQPRNSLFCVTATYSFEDAKVPTSIPFLSPSWDGTVISVYNQANVDQVNGALQNSGNSTLCARLEDPELGAKLAVAPCFLPNSAAGPYWILSVGENEDGHYEWAIVIAGEPTEPFADGCTTKQTGVNGAGLWLFSRKPVASEDTMIAMHNELATKGITSTKLIKVEQDGCIYEGAFIKTDAS